MRPPKIEKFCKNCKKIKTREEFYIKNNSISQFCRECTKLRTKKYKADHPNWKKEYDASHKQQNREQYLKYSKTEKGKEALKRRDSKKRRSNLEDAVSAGIRVCLKRNKQGQHWESLVGYTLEDLKLHLESHFLSGMTWENYGRNGWHIDHLIPLS